MCKGLVVLVALLAGASCPGQIIYEPVRFEYGQGSGKFYYGGGDPAMIAYGHSQPVPQVSPPPLVVYSDARPWENVAIYGYGINDARDDAYANVPCYFRKRDLLAAAVPQPDGTWVVPAQAQPVVVPNDGRAQVVPRPILIITTPHFPPRSKSNNIVVTMR